MRNARMGRTVGLILILALTLGAWKCDRTTKNLAVASDAIAHALLNAQTAAKQGVADGVISPDDEKQFEVFLVRASQAGMTLDTAIRNNQSATDVSGQVSAFLEAFNALNTNGVAGIKNKNLQLTISTILNGAEVSIGVIAATVGGGK